jgi:pimeloyl-ACP methyl ester carboxylesterase
MDTTRPELGRSIEAGGMTTNYLEAGSASNAPVVLIHGSGPGVTAYANWRLTLPALAESSHVVAPDMVGFGFTSRPADGRYDVDRWVAQAVGLLDALGLAKAHIVGNSFGGALALHLATRYPERVDKLVLMGSVGLSFPITDGLDAVWGYEPSVARMRELLDIFAYDRELVTDELAQTRYEASVQPGFQEAFAAMFPPPRQRWVDALALAPEAVAAIPHETLVIHGRDDKVIPVDVSVQLARLIQRSELHVFGRCGHWTQIEWADEFNALVARFLSRPPR